MRWLLVFFTASFALFDCRAVHDIEAVKTAIMHRLRQKNPSVIADFAHFFQRYDQLVQNFFDLKNEDSLRIHVQRMEQEAQILKRVCYDARFSCVRALLLPHYEDVFDLIDVLKKYSASKNYISLALAVRRFKSLLPLAIKKRGELHLLWALRHRLLCEE